MTGARLSAIPLFAGFDDIHLKQIEEASTRRQLAAGQVLFAEGDSGSHAYVIIEGDLEVVKQSGDREVLLAVRGVGDVIGEMSLLEDAPRMATVRARTDAVLLDVPKAVLDEMLATSTVANRALFGVLLSRWRETESRLRQREQLARLGTLSAGLAHELNNPAAAAKRAAAEIPAAADRLAGAAAALERTDDPDAARVIADRLANAPGAPRLGSMARSDREEELTGRLRQLGIDRPSPLAAVLVEVDVTAVEGVLDGLEGSDDAGAVVAFAVARREVAALASMALDAAGRIADIVGAVKSYSYLDKAPIQEVDLAVGLDDTLVLLAHRLDDIEVVREYGAVPPFPAYGSELNQVWTNLIDNAVDAVRDAGRVPGRITLRIGAAEGLAVVEVEDDGPGIPEDVLPRVFDSFYTTKPPGSGTGLGLDISYGIVVHRHGGEIDIDSEPGRTTVRVRIPLKGPA